MKTICYLFFLIIGLTNCFEKGADSTFKNVEIASFPISQQISEKPKPIQKFNIQLTENQELSYPQVKAKIKTIRTELASKNISLDSLSNIFTNLLLNNLIPFWYGTEWSFEGHTAIPKNGTIACGYFVSTTLRDMGMNINRYKLAQQSPINEAKTLALNQRIIEINNPSKQENITQIKDELKEGIHFIGFDQSHVGYILKRKNELFLIHSNYVDSQGVMIERIEESTVFGYYERFYLVEISTNFDLLKRWKTNQKIEIVN